MTKAARLVASTLLLTAPVGPAVAGGPDYAQSWTDLLEACVRYVETGQRDVFASWDIAWPGGGVCNGDPSCEKSVMIFIGNNCYTPGKTDLTVCTSGVGAVQVSVSEDVVGNQPAQAACGSAIGLRHQPDQIGAADAHWLATAVAQGRLVRHAKGYAGCGWNDQSFDLRSDPSHSSFHLRFPASDLPSPCEKVSS